MTDNAKLSASIVVILSSGDGFGGFSISQTYGLLISCDITLLSEFKVVGRLIILPYVVLVLHK